MNYTLISDSFYLFSKKYKNNLTNFVFNFCTKYRIYRVYLLNNSDNFIVTKLENEYFLNIKIYSQNYIYLSNLMKKAELLCKKINHIEIIFNRKNFNDRTDYDFSKFKNLVSFNSYGIKLNQFRTISNNLKFLFYYYKRYEINVDLGNLVFPNLVYLELGKVSDIFYNGIVCKKLKYLVLWFIEDNYRDDSFKTMTDLKYLGIFNCVNFIDYNINHKIKTFDLIKRENHNDEYGDIVLNINVKIDNLRMNSNIIRCLDKYLNLKGINCENLYLM